MDMKVIENLIKQVADAVTVLKQQGVLSADTPIPTIPDTTVPSPAPAAVPPVVPFTSLAQAAPALGFVTALGNLADIKSSSVVLPVVVQPDPAVVGGAALGRTLAPNTTATAHVDRPGPGGLPFEPRTGEGERNPPNFAGATTGRTSSDKPNTQNAPVAETQEQFRAAVEALALKTKNRDDFVKAAKDALKVGLTNARALYGDARKRLIADGKWKDGATGLQRQVEEIRADKLEKVMDAPKGVAAGQLKPELAGDKHADLVQIARRIGRELAKAGPITIDDLTEAMSQEHNVAPNKNNPRVWKGKVFNKSEWVYIGARPSRQAVAHARPVGLWALKTWLKDHTMNGEGTLVSSFNVARILREFTHTNRNMPLAQCRWYIGNATLSTDIAKRIIDGKGLLYEVPVIYVDGGIGAVLVPPQPKTP